MHKTNSGCLQEEVKARFCGLWNRSSLAETGADSIVVWEKIDRAYNEPWRQYHTMEHLCHCLQQLDLTSSLMEDPAAVEIALWFHDTILQPDAADNEEKSAELFRRTAEMHLPPNLVNKVSNLILATEHRDPPQGHDTRYLCDIDLSSLASPWEQFLKDSNALRAEQSGTADAEFYPAKIGFLSTLLERPTVFLTETFQARYERAARENIQRYITQLEADGHS